MSKFKKLIKSPEIQLALVTGFSIILMAYVSKRVLPKPIGYLTLAIPPFVATMYEAAAHRHRDSRICTTWYWITAVLVATALVILFHAV